MLWLAGIMGLVAVGAVTFVELDKDDDEDVPPVEGPKLDHEQEDAVAAAQQAITDANGGTQTFPGDTDTLNPPSPPMIWPLTATTSLPVMRTTTTLTPWTATIRSGGAAAQTNCAAGRATT